MNVLTIGTFDGVHPGHLELLAECRRLVGVNGRVLVGVNRDEFVHRYKGKDPALTLAHRLEVLTALRDVDAVFVNIGDENSGLLIDVVRPDILAIGDDWLDGIGDERRYHKQLGIDQAWLDCRGLRIAYIARTRGLSSSELRKAS
jgi:cytidyltransferase-like protein